jgi:uncharacterized protein (UPF0333 family)
MKGLTSIELAILLAIIIVIAVAVGWWVYTTYLATASGSPTLQIVSAQYNSTDNKLMLYVINPGPVNNVGISTVYLSGQQCTTDNFTVPLSSKPLKIIATCNSISAAAGTRLSGQLVTTAGTAFLFNAVVTS